MAIRRGSIPADSFTIISNAWLRDPRLSLKAKGLAAYISSHSPNHVLTVEQILAENTDGKDAVRAGMAELEERGYLCREQVRGDGGRISRTDYVLKDPADGGFASAGKPAPGADQGKRPVSAGHDQGGKTGAGEPAGKKTTPPTEGKKTTEKTPSAAPRGTRLPDDWKPSAKLGEWLLSKLPEGAWSEHSRRWAVHCTEKFTLYWHAKAGAAGRHVDWDKTWQRWMLTELERYRPAVAGMKPAAAGQFKNSAEKQADKAERDKVRGKLVDTLIEKGMAVQEAFDAVEAELRRREGLGEVITLDACLVPGYIDAKVIDTSTTTTREVTA